LKHAEALKNIAEYGDPGRLHLVLEDDSVLSDAEQLRALLARRPSDGAADVTFACLNVQREGGDDDGRGVVDVDMLFKSAFVLPACNAYFVTPKAAKIMMPHVYPIKLPWNAQLAYVLHRAGASLTVNSAEKCVWRDGSKSGHFVSALNNDNALTQNDSYNALKEICAKAMAGGATASLDDTIATLTSRFFDDPGVLKDHPDFLRVHAAYLTAQQRHAEAHALLERASRTLSASRVSLSKSAVVREYIRSFAHVQDAVT
jgi:hypothetical protein